MRRFLGCRSLKHAVMLGGLFAIFGLASTAWVAPRIPQPLLDHSLVYCTSFSDFSFNPQRAEVGSNMNVVTEQIYDKLLAFDPITNRLKPALAERFSVSDDGLTILFQLRQKVAFHQTKWFTPSRFLNADDVVFSLNRMMGKDLELPELSTEQQATRERYRINRQIADKAHFSYFESIHLNHRIAEISAPTPYSVKIRLTEADNSLLAHLASQYAVILSKEYALQLNADDNLAQLNRLPVGTGVYQVENYVQNDHVRLQPNPHYWGKKAHLEQMIVDFSTTGTGRMAKFLNGECDVTAFPEPSQMSVVPSTLGKTVQSAGANVAFLAFNMQRPTMQSLALRQQITQAIDRKRLAKTLFYQTAEVAQNLLPRALFPENNATGYRYPSAEVRQNLPEGDRLILWVVDEKKVYNPHPLKMAELIRADLGKVGIRVEVRAVSRAYLVQQLARQQADYDLILGGWLANNFDPDSFLYPLLSCAAQGSVTNLSQWCDPELDSLLQTARLSEDSYARDLIYRQVQRRLEAQLPLLPLVNVNRMLLVNHKVARATISHFGQVQLSDMQLRTKK